MKLLYFDAFAGASGDMILGAVVAAGADAGALRDKLKLLGVGNYELEFRQVMRAGISAMRAVVRTESETEHRNLNDILTIINSSPLEANVQERASKIFTRLAEAESRVHNESIERVHFHEVGATDSIVDIVGACIGIEMLGVNHFRASALHTGSGTVEMAHGRFPVPPPAVIELLQDAPVYQTEITGELLTPTGAAIISTLCAGDYGVLPPMRLLQTGYGAGGREYARFPNALRIIIGEIEDLTACEDGCEKLTMLETNLDDLSGQITGHLMEAMLAAGALDCYFTSVQMKKNRPGVLVSVLCHEGEAARLRELLFHETTTLGIRVYTVDRYALRREFQRVETKFGAIDVKVAYLNGVVRGGEPEFEQCRAAAALHNVSVRAVEAAARSEFQMLHEKSEFENAKGDE